MTNSIVRVLSAALLALGILFAGPVHADASAEAFVKARQAELTALLRKENTEANQREIAAVFDRMLDYDRLAKEALGPYWDERTPEERKEFQALLTELVQRAYRKNLRKTLDYEVSFKGQDSAKSGYLVQTVAHHKTNPRAEQVTIDYALHKVQGQWRVYDIITEGSSLVSNYRSQFRRIIKKNGFPGLIERMKKKVNEDGDG